MSGVRTAGRIPTLSAYGSRGGNLATEAAVYQRPHARTTVEIWRRTSGQIRACWLVTELLHDILYGWCRLRWRLLALCSWRRILPLVLLSPRAPCVFWCVSGLLRLAGGFSLRPPQLALLQQMRLMLGLGLSSVVSLNSLAAPSFWLLPALQSHTLSVSSASRGDVLRPPAPIRTRSPSPPQPKKAPGPSGFQGWRLRGTRPRRSGWISERLGCQKQPDCSIGPRASLAYSCMSGSGHVVQLHF